MNEIPLGVLFGVLIFLLILSAFFSGSETGLMTLNRYRLRHLAQTKHAGAMRAQKLLERPDRLIGLILLGNNFVNILASSIVTIIAMRMGGQGAIAIGAGLLTLAILIFSEVAPKTLAALHPERIAFPAALIYTPLLQITYPLVWAVNIVANTLLRIIGIKPEDDAGVQHLTREELRTVVNEAGSLIPKRHQSMLISILDLEKVTVEDIMVPRNDIQGIDLDEDWNEIEDQLAHAQHTRLPVYRGDIDHIEGIVHLRNIVHTLANEELTKEALMGAMRDPYFIPEATPLNTQLLNFQRQERRIGLVVNEYGDIQGLVTLEDILEEIVGEFTSDPSTSIREVHPQDDGSFLIDASINIRELNRALNLHLSTSGPKTLNGLITEYLESIPEPGTSIKISDYPIEIVQVAGNAVKTARIFPALRSKASVRRD